MSDRLKHLTDLYLDDAGRPQNRNKQKGTGKKPADYMPKSERKMSNRHPDILRQVRLEAPEGMLRHGKQAGAYGAIDLKEIHNSKAYKAMMELCEKVEKRHESMTEAMTAAYKRTVR